MTRVTGRFSQLLFLVNATYKLQAQGRLAYTWHELAVLVGDAS